MAMGRLLTATDAVVAMDYGQFWLCGGWGDDDPMELLEAALAGDGIAGNGLCVVLCSPHQNNFEMPLRVEVWSDPPPDDLMEWDEIFESGLAVDEDGLRYQSPTFEETIFQVPSGRYALRICGRGFVVNRGWPGTTTPGDVWRAQLWPSHAAVDSRRIKAWQPVTAS
jgi:hypothetical protein